MGIIVLALVTTGYQSVGDSHVPVWVILLCAAVLSRHVRGRLADHADTWPEGHRIGSA